MKETAVDWLINKISEDYPEIPKAYREECNKAKEMEKEQIQDAYLSGEHQQGFEGEAEQYYNETYEK